MNKAIINQLPIEQLRGKRAFLRIDANMEETVEPSLDDYKLRAVLPTIEHLIAAEARVVIGTHLGDPHGRPIESLRVDPIARRLSSLIGKPVRKFDEAIGREVLTAVAELRNGEVVLLENLRFYPGEDGNDPQLARELAELCDVYCNDAFPVAHRGQASTVAITPHVRPSTAGLALARELTMFELVIDRREAPFVGLIAGARIEEKLAVLDNLLPKFNHLFIGGALAFLFLKAQGRETGAAHVDEALLPLAEELLNKAMNVDIILPEDFRVVHANLFKVFEASGRRLPVPPSWEMWTHEITPTDLPVDIGPHTVKRITQLIEAARTLFWNGPLGICEIEPFAAGTREVARALIGRAPPNQRSVVCGNSLARAIHSFELSFEQFRHLSTGGECALQLVAGKQLPAVTALDDPTDLTAPVEKRPHKILLAVDGSEPSLEAAEKLGALDTAGAEIDLIYVQKPLEPKPEYYWMDETLKRRRELERRLEGERVVAAALARLARRGLSAQKQIIVEGDAASEILKFSDQTGVDLIAMGSHGRTGLLGVFLGSVSRKVLNQANCPVLIARVSDQRPPEEESP